MTLARSKIATLFVTISLAFLAPGCPCGVGERRMCVGDECQCGAPCDRCNTECGEGRACVLYIYDGEQGVCVDETWEWAVGRAVVGSPLDCDGGGPGDHTHDVECFVLPHGATGPESALSGPATVFSVGSDGSFSTPDGGRGPVFGLCRTLPADDGHFHDVTFRVFNDGYAAMSGPSEQIYFQAPQQACTASSVSSECGRWFGQAVTTSDHGHVHDVMCSVFNPMTGSEEGPADAIYWLGSGVCVPGPAPEGACGLSFGNCLAR